MIELTPFHFECLKKFAGVRALTETGLARAVSKEKVIVKHAIKTLVGQGLLKNYGPYEFTLSHEGTLHLKSKGAPLTEPAKSPKSDSLAKLEALDLPPSGNLQIEKATIAAAEIPAFLPAVAKWSEQGDDEQPTERKTIQDWAEVKKAAALELEQLKEQAAAEARPDFTTLVRQGLERLNKQLSIEQHQIEDIDLKIETLAKLSASVESISQEMAAILRATSKDLHRIKYGK